LTLSRVSGFYQAPWLPPHSVRSQNQVLLYGSVLQAPDSMGKVAMLIQGVPPLCADRAIVARRRYRDPLLRHYNQRQNQKSKLRNFHHLDCLRSLPFPSQRCESIQSLGGRKTQRRAARSRNLEL
jgi:hypothetical protein